MRKYLFTITLFTVLSMGLNAQVPTTSTILDKVNEIRSEGHYCGRKYMPPSDPVSWNNKLFKSAMSHAQEMRKYKYFSHTSKRGKSVGKRVEKFDYDWVFVGENIAVGQKSLDETLVDWLESTSHCEVLLSRHVKEIAIAKAGKYRVMHLGRRG